jgi:transposase
LPKACLHACAITPSGDRLWDGRCPRTPAGLAALTARCSTRSALAVEASTPTWHVADALLGSVGDRRMVDPLKTTRKAGDAATTDRLDARRLAEALRRDRVVGIYAPSLATREVRERCRSRHARVQGRPALITRLRAGVRRQGRADARRLARTADDGWLEGLGLPPQAAARVARRRRVLTTVRHEAAQAEADVRRLSDADPMAIPLPHVRGMGPVLAVTIRAAIADIRRFPTGGHVARYAGLVPRVDASAGRVRYGRITRRGAPWWRWALIEAAIHGTTRRDRIGRGGRGLAVRKGALTARVALARVWCAEIPERWSAVAGWPLQDGGVEVSTDHAGVVP